MRGPTEFAGIVEFSRVAGLSREHVYRVLIGKRESRAVETKWKLWQQGKLQPAPNKVRLAKAAPALLEACEALLNSPIVSGMSAAIRNDANKRQVENPFKLAATAIARAKGQP